MMNTKVINFYMVLIIYMYMYVYYQKFFLKTHQSFRLAGPCVPNHGNLSTIFKTDKNTMSVLLSYIISE